MREFVQYVASDGAVFDTKAECLEYEAVEASKHSVISYDSTTLKQTSYEIADAMYLHDEDAVEAFMKVSDYYGFHTDGVNGPGAYILDPVDGGSWLRIDDCIEKLQNLVKIMHKDWGKMCTRKMTPNEYRRRHKRCRFCKYAYTPQDYRGTYRICAVKLKVVNDKLPRIFLRSI